MEFLFNSDWDELLIPKVAIAEALVRGVLSYVLLCVLMRIIPKRQAGSSSPNDMLVLVLIGGFATEIMGEGLHSALELVLTVGVVLCMSYLADWLAYRFPWARRLLESPATPVIRDGRVLTDNLRKELLSEEELAAQLRLQGVGEVGSVRAAFVEANGEISVLQSEKAEVGEARTELDALLPGLSLDTRCKSLHERNGLGGVQVLDRAVPSAPVSKTQPVMQEEPELKAFLDAIRGIQARVRWHQEQCANHQDAVKHFREVLADHGVRVTALSRRTGQAAANGTAAADTIGPE